jgi:hypothetical protein
MAAHRSTAKQPSRSTDTRIAPAPTPTAQPTADAACPTPGAAGRGTIAGNAAGAWPIRTRLPCRSCALRAAGRGSCASSSTRRASARKAAAASVNTIRSGSLFAIGARSLSCPARMAAPGGRSPERQVTSAKGPASAAPPRWAKERWPTSRRVSNRRVATRPGACQLCDSATRGQVSGSSSSAAP